MGFGKSEPTRCEEQVEHSCNTRSAELAAGRVRQRQCVWRRFCRASGRGNQGAPLAAGGGSCRSRHLAKGAVVSHHPRGSSVAATAPESESAPPYENPNLTESNPESESAKTESDTSTASAPSRIISTPQTNHKQPTKPWRPQSKSTSSTTKLFTRTSKSTSPSRLKSSKRSSSHSPAYPSTAKKSSSKESL